MFTCGGSSEICVNHYYSCSYFAAILSDLVFTIDGKKYIVPPSGYLIQDLSGLGCDILVGSVPD